MPGAPPPWSREEPAPPKPPAQEFPSCPILHGRSSRMETVYIRTSSQQEESREIILHLSMVTELFPAGNRSGRHLGIARLPGAGAPKPATGQYRKDSPTPG